ncbi:hypothetical protein GIB67_011994 [Kingdonia uniflora]|uniref:Uncharacterized protein n=1 Tax=Kingdonia uniflora TaxID=39325 RepID=A0A7J7M027_9MAGN|nr:hypothetical protein GIB67_011994 [Kingdonia uniflora]
MLYNNEDDVIILDEDVGENVGVNDVCSGGGYSQAGVNNWAEIDHDNLNADEGYYSTHISLDGDEGSTQEDIYKVDVELSNLAQDTKNIFANEENDVNIENPHQLIEDLVPEMEWPTLHAAMSYIRRWSILNKIRDRLLHRAFEKLNLMMMKLIYDRRYKADEWNQTGLVPRVKEHIAKIEIFYGQYHPEGAGDGCHVTIGANGKRYCSPYHRVSSYVETYKKAIYPILDPSEWGKGGEQCSTDGADTWNHYRYITSDEEEENEWQCGWGDDDLSNNNSNNSDDKSEEEKEDDESKEEKEADESEKEEDENNDSESEEETETEEDDSDDKGDDRGVAGGDGGVAGGGSS